MLYVTEKEDEPDKLIGATWNNKIGLLRMVHNLES
jgi:hypothetical protein